MEKKSMFMGFIIIFLLCGLVYSQEITVTSPNGGENLVRGAVHNITWTSLGITSGTFVVKLFNGNSAVGTIQTGIACSNGTHSIPWTVGGLVRGGPAEDGANYRIKIRQASLAPMDFSDSTFNISTPGAPEVITVTSPNGGENLITGEIHNITWTSSGITSGTFVVKLFAGDTVVGTIQGGIPCTNGAHSIPWTVGNLNGEIPVPSGGNYKIKIRQASLAPMDFSEGVFSISPPGPAPSITVTSPNGGEVWEEGGPNQNITWTSSGISSGSYKISLYKGGDFFADIASNVPFSTNVFNWELGTFTSPGAFKLNSGNDFKIKVKVMGQAVEDMSDNNFTYEITRGVQESPLTVSRPIANQFYLAGFPTTIRWRSAMLLSKTPKSGSTSLIREIRRVKIEIKSAKYTSHPQVSEILKKLYSQQALKLKKKEISLLMGRPWLSNIPQWETIVENIENQGQYAWTIPGNFKKGCYKIRVTLSGSGKAKGESGVFHIIPVLRKPGVVLPEVIKEMKI